MPFTLNPTDTSCPAALLTAAAAPGPRLPPPATRMAPSKPCRLLWGPAGAWCCTGRCVLQGGRPAPGARLQTDGLSGVGLGVRAGWGPGGCPGGGWWPLRRSSVIHSDCATWGQCITELCLERPDPSVPPGPLAQPRRPLVVTPGPPCPRGQHFSTHPPPPRVCVLPGDLSNACKGGLILKGTGRGWAGGDTAQCRAWHGPTGTCLVSPSDSCCRGGVCESHQHGGGDKSPWVPIRAGASQASHQALQGGSGLGWGQHPLAPPRHQVLCQAPLGKGAGSMGHLPQGLGGGWSPGLVAPRLLRGGARGTGG